MEQNNPTPIVPTPPVRPKTWSKVIALIVLLIILAGAGFWFNKNRQSKPANTASNNQVEAVTNTEPPKKEVPAGWQEFRHDVLGLTFNYPPEWGKPATAPKTDITELKTVVEGLDNTNGYYNNISVGFANKAPILIIFNDSYTGERAPYGDVMYTQIDNIPKLKSTGNICDYKIDLPAGSQAETEKEIYSSCVNRVKVSVLEITQFFGPPTGTLYTYRLIFYGYSKLQNGVFNNLLTSLVVDDTHQLKDRLTAEQFFEKQKIQLSDNKDLATFTAFANTIESYPPPQKQHQVFTVSANEDPDITTIRKYYYDLVQSTPKIYKATPDLFTKLGPSDYEFWVKYQEQNEELKQERVKAKIMNGKVKTYFTDILNGDQSASGDYLAYAASRGDKNIVLLREGDKETVIDSAPNDFDKTLDTLVFANLEFSPKGNYLVYTGWGWEWALNRIYDIKNKVKVLETASGNGGFNQAENIYYFCDSNEFGGDYNAVVYKVPGFTTKLDLLELYPDLKDFQNIDCTVDSAKNVINFTFSGKYDKNQNFDENVKTVYLVDFNTGELLAK